MYRGDVRNLGPCTMVTLPYNCTVVIIPLMRNDHPFVDGDHAMCDMSIYIHTHMAAWLLRIPGYPPLLVTFGVPTQHLDHTMWNAGAKQSRQSRCQFYVGQRLLWQPHSCAALCCFNSRRSDCHGGSSSYSNSSQFMAKVARWGTTKMTGYWLRRFTRPYQLRDIHWWIGWEP